MDDRAVVEAQIERPARSVVDVVARCHLDVPVVIAVPPYLDDGTPFPTRYWLTCPLATRRIGRVESRGGVKAAERRIEHDPEYRRRFEAASSRYAAEREALIPADAPDFKPTGGVAGAMFGVKCLHAHYADHAAGNDNPVGEETAGAIEPLDCVRPCVAEVDGVVVRNPIWVEPKR